MKKIIVFTDLDGSLLHPKTYSFIEALPALDLLREKDIPLVLCSSKTKAEIEVYRKRLQNGDPFVAENGGAIFVPVGYFIFPTGSIRSGDYTISAFGKPYAEIRKEFTELRESLHVPVKGFGDMTVKEISELTGLSPDEAELARQREFGEPFVFERGTDERFLRAIEDRGLHWTQGRLHYLMGDHDKGKAVRLLKQWYESKRGKLISIGIGDSLNDLPLLREVDRPVLVQKEDEGYDQRVRVPHLIKAKGIGPSGWNKAVLELIEHGS